MTGERPREPATTMRPHDELREWKVRCYPELPGAKVSGSALFSPAPAGSSFFAWMRPTVTGSALPFLEGHTSAVRRAFSNQRAGPNFRSSFDRYQVTSLLRSPVGMVSRALPPRCGEPLLAATPRRASRPGSPPYHHLSSYPHPF